MTMPAGVARARKGSATPVPTIRDIGAGDVKDALRAGWADFIANPTHWLFLGLIYPVVGLVLAFAFSGANLIPLIFPLMSGFALVGPFAAIGVYEMSKRREEGLEPSWDDAQKVLHSPAIKSILVMGLLLFAIFFVWLMVAWTLYSITVGDYVPTTLGDFIRHTLTTSRGWVLIIAGNIAGFMFAVGVLAISAISFPLLLDRPTTDVRTAVRTSVEAIKINPKSMAVWGIIVAALLLAGSIPFFVGLAVVVPLLGHATWHLYRKTIA